MAVVQAREQAVGKKDIPEAMEVSKRQAEGRKRTIFLGLIGGAQ
jgi:hypothetical protein